MLRGVHHCLAGCQQQRALPVSERREEGHLLLNAQLPCQCLQLSQVLPVLRQPRIVAASHHQLRTASGLPLLQLLQRCQCKPDALLALKPAAATVRYVCYRLACCEV
eukprot:GHRQ01011926.1.p2 GENE.GHRQ01011926.1~~GHRQ01011926.1.p2  ORF type:complete len:107 (-),score=24.14 GHRQ01011926.1:159-479(-)